MIIAIDFDSTIVEEIYPYIGPVKSGAKEVINRLSNEGHTIIINSCRSGLYEGYMEEFLNKEGILYDWINCNTPSQIEKFGRDCRKISADIYVDDKNLGGIPDDWNEIYYLIELEWNKRKVLDTTKEN
jgi:hypothetical protein